MGETKAQSPIIIGHCPQSAMIKNNCDSFSSSDVNECEHDYDNACHPNATCENFPGSYRCNCKVKVKPGASCQGRHKASPSL